MRISSKAQRSLLVAAFVSLSFNLVAAPAFAATAWNESVDGDLSSDGLAPTPLQFVPGSNTVKGSMGSGDIDYFRFTVPSGALLTAVNVTPGTSVSGAQSFFAIQVGTQITVTPTGGGTGPGSLLAFDHYDVADIGTNLLARLMPNSTGLPAGAYSIWLNETGGVAPYSFDFVLSSVPEPAAAGLFVTGLGALVLRMRMARSHRGC